MHSLTPHLHCLPSLRAALCFGTLLVTGPASLAALLANDPFSYPDGPLTGNPASSWHTHSGTEGTLLVKDQQLELSASRSEDANSTLAGGPYRTDSDVNLYASFKLKVVKVPSPAGTYFAHFKDEHPDTASGYAGRVFVCASNTVAGYALEPGKFRLGIANGSNGSAASGQVDVDLSTNEVYTVVTRFVPGTGLATIWLDPQSEFDASVTAVDEGAGNIMAVGGFAFRQASGEGTLLVDDLRVGTSFSDVAGGNTAPTLSPIADQQIPANASTETLPFTVGDAEMAADELLVSVSSSDESLLPLDGLALTGGGTQRFLTVTPAPDRQGSASVTLQVSDGINSVSISFLVRVGFPSIIPLEDQNSVLGADPQLVPFRVQDSETEPTALIVSTSSSDEELLPASGIELLGTGKNRVVRLTPVAGRTGITTLTLTVSDGSNQTSTSFRFTVSPKLGMLFEEHFDYLEFANPNALSTAVGSLWQTTSGTASDIQVSNSCAFLCRNLTEDLAAPLLQGPHFASNSVVFYASCVGRWSRLPSTAGNYFLHFRDSLTGVGYRSKIFVRASDTSTNAFCVGIANGENLPVYFPRDLQLNQDYTFAFRYNAGTADGALWLNPSSEQDEHVHAADHASPATVGFLALRQDSGIGDLTIESLRVGTSFQDILAQVAPAPIPISFQVVDGQLVLSWEDPRFSLEASSSAAGPFEGVPAAQSPFKVDVQAAAAFYRLAYP